MSRAAATVAALLLVGACRHASKVGAEGAPGRGAEGEAEPSRAQKGVPPRGEHPRVPSSPKALLAEGEIGKIQEALAQRGYLAKYEPGKLDAPTTAAIRKFQKDGSLAETGFPDRLTLRMLGLDPEVAYSTVKEPKAVGEQRRSAQAGAPATTNGDPGAKGSAGEGGNDAGKR